MSKRTGIVFSIVAGLAFCLLVGCGGGGGGSTASNVTGVPVVAPQNPSPMQPNEPDEPDTKTGEPDTVEPVFNPFPASITHDSYSEDLPLWDGLLNEVKFNLIKAQSAWESGYTGKEVVVGIMEQTDQFHVLFGSEEKNKVHPKSILTSPYPDDLPAPPEKYITDQLTKHPEFTCHLQFEDVNYCPDTSGNQKYFLRDENGDIHVLPGLMDFNPKCTTEEPNDLMRKDCEHDEAYNPENLLCPTFIRGEEEKK